MCKTMEVKDWRELVMRCAAAFSHERTPGGVFYLEMPKMIRELEAENRALRKKLEKYRAHAETCSCGFVKALRALDTDGTEEEKT